MNLRKFLMLLFAVLIAAAFIGCGRELPPDDSTKAPANLNGKFSCAYGTLIFNGDGRTVTADLSSEFTQSEELPQGKFTATYVFLFRNEELRYDLAETFKLIIGDQSYKIISVPKETNETAITLRLRNGERAVFKKDD